MLHCSKKRLASAVRSGIYVAMQQRRSRGVPSARPGSPRMQHGSLRHLFPEHRLHLGLAPPDLPGAPEELFAAAAQAYWLGVADSGRGEALLRAHRIEIVAAARRGLPILLALQHPADAVEVAAWLRAVRPGWSMRYSLELVDAFEAEGLIPSLAALAAAA
jgi:hypothetical protein